jgi:hypothetical protein
MQQYDIATKVLIDSCRDDIIRFLMDLPVRESRLMESLPQETVSLKRGDYPILITDNAGKQKLAVIEIQTDWRRFVPLHLIDYRVRYMLKHDVEAVTCVLLLRPSASATDRYEDSELRFQFKLVKIYEMDAAAILAGGPLCMLPFVPLMRGGEAALDQAESLIYGSEKTRPEKADMLTSMAILSGLISADMPARLIERRKDIMIESAAYDIIKKEGFVEGIEEGMEKGIEKTIKDFMRLGTVTNEQIALATGFSVEEIQRLKQSLGADRGNENERHD